MSEATLAEVLEFREKKAFLQSDALRDHPGAWLLCLSMNIPGPEKASPSIVRAFRAGLDAIEKAVSDTGSDVFHKITLEENAGQFGLYAVSGTAGLKSLAITVEEEHPLGRLFDVDVISDTGHAVSRTEIGLPPRRCLVCMGDAKACGRSRTHSVRELQNKVYQIISGWEAMKNDI